MIDLYRAYGQWQQNQKLRRISEQEEIYHYYTGRKDKIEEYLYSALQKSFDSEDISEMQLSHLNFTKKLINQIAVIYREPAYRYLDNGETVIDGDGNEVNPLSDEMNEYYDKILPSRINTKDKKAHRFAKCFNTSLTQIVFNKGKIDYVIRPSWLYDVEYNEDDYSLIQISYPKYFRKENGTEELFQVVWTDTEHYTFDAVGVRRGVGDNTQMINPYGRIPFSVLRLEEQEDFWGNGIYDVVKINENINFLLTFLLNENIIMGTSGTLVATNLDLRKRGIEESGYRKVRTGRKHPVTVENVTSDKVAPNLQYVSTNPYIPDIRSTIDWLIKDIALMRGLNPNSFLADVQATSGYSKIIDSLEQLEMRKDDEEACREFEMERFNITRIVNNHHALTGERREYDLKEIPDDFELFVDFAELEMIKSSDEIWSERENEYKYGISSPIDWMLEKNQDLTEESAEMYIRRNIKLKKDLERKLTILETLEEDKDEPGQPTE